MSRLPPLLELRLMIETQAAKAEPRPRVPGGEVRPIVLPVARDQIARSPEMTALFKAAVAAGVPVRCRDDAEEP